MIDALKVLRLVRIMKSLNDIEKAVDLALSNAPPEVKEKVKKLIETAKSTNDIDTLVEVYANELGLDKSEAYKFIESIKDILPLMLESLEEKNI